MRRYLLFAIFSVFLTQAHAQSKRVMDSLERLYQETSTDTARFRIVIEMINKYRLGDLAKAGEKCDQLTELAEKIDLPLYRARAIYNQAVQSRKEGEYETAIRQYQEALTIFEQENDGKNIASVNGSLGITHWNQGNYDLAISYLRKALDYGRKIGNKNGIGTNLNNLAGVYLQKSEYDSAIICLKEMRTIYEELKDTAGLADAYGNIGAVYLQKGDTANGLSYSLEAIRYSEISGYRYQLGSALANVANVYELRGDYATSEKYFMDSYRIFAELGSKEGIRDSYKSLATLYGAWGNYKSAFEYMKKHKELNDSILSEARMKQLTEMDAKYQSAQKDKQLLAEKAESERKSMLLYSLFTGLLLVITLAFFAWRGYRNKKRLSEEIRQQKEIIETKSKEMVDSIHYAERIQRGLLPSEDLLHRLFPESFVFLRPKDIVAGDFYWLEEKDGLLLFAVADCTGHGVPGALVSVVCSNALNRSVNEFGVTDPGPLLGKVRELVLESFGKSSMDVRDGMDISLCSYDPRSRTLRWAGANNPLWLARNGEMLTLTPDKMPIGKHTDLRPFTTHHLQLQSGDCVYLFSDGFADQFGGPAGKKFKYKQLKELLLQVHTQPMNEQMREMEKTFTGWKGGLEQVDDVCVLGVRIS